MITSNMLFWTLTNGNTFSLPEGFLFASIYPLSGASFTITNSLNGDGIQDVSLKTSAEIDTAYTFPPSPMLSGWNQHIITAIGGDVIITYATGK